MKLVTGVPILREFNSAIANGIENTPDKALIFDIPPSGVKNIGYPFVQICLPRGKQLLEA